MQEKNVDWRRRAFCCLVLLWAGACQDVPTAAVDAQEECAPNGSLSVAVYGDLRGELDWRGAALSCGGMPRPHGAGARLRFGGEIVGDQQRRRLAFIIALPELERDRLARETPARVTLMEEDGGRFFSTRDADICWSDVVEQSPIDADSYSIAGRVYCVAPLAELNGSGGVTLSDLEFRGRIDWAAPE